VSVPAGGTVLIISDHLHCMAVKICGRDVDRLMVAGDAALDLGLEVWFSPLLVRERQGALPRPAGAPDGIFLNVFEYVLSYNNSFYSESV